MLGNFAHEGHLLTARLEVNINCVVDRRQFRLGKLRVKCRSDDLNDGAGAGHGGSKKFATEFATMCAELRAHSTSSSALLKVLCEESPRAQNGVRDGFHRGTGKIPSSTPPRKDVGVQEFEFFGIGAEIRVIKTPRAKRVQITSAARVNAGAEHHGSGDFNSVRSARVHGECACLRAAGA